MYYITYFSYTYYPLAPCSQYSDEKDAFITHNIQKGKNEMQRRLCELPNITRLVRRGLELSPISVWLQTNIQPISHYSLPEQFLWCFDRKHYVLAIMLTISYSNSSPCSKHRPTFQTGFLLSFACHSKSYSTQFLCARNSFPLRTFLSLLKLF